MARLAGRKPMSCLRLRLFRHLPSPPRWETHPPRESCQNRWFLPSDTWYGALRTDPRRGEGAKACRGHWEPLLPGCFGGRRVSQGRLTHPVGAWNTAFLLRDAVAIIGGPGDGGVRAADATMNPVPRGPGIGRPPDAFRLPR